MQAFMLDTNIAIDVIKRRPASALKLLNRHHGRKALSSIVLAELLHGAANSSGPPRNLAVVEDFCSRLTVLDSGTKVASHDGRIDAGLTLTRESWLRGTPSSTTASDRPASIGWQHEAEFQPAAVVPPRHADSAFQATSDVWVEA